MNTVHYKDSNGALHSAYIVQEIKKGSRAGDVLARTFDHKKLKIKLELIQRIERKDHGKNIL